MKKLALAFLALTLAASHAGAQEDGDEPASDEQEAAAPEAPSAAPIHRRAQRPARPAPAPARAQPDQAPSPSEAPDAGVSLGGQGMGTIERAPTARSGFSPMVPVQKAPTGGGGPGSAGANGLTRVGSFNSLPCWNNSGGPSAVQPVCAKALIVIDKVGGGYAVPFRVEDPSIEFELVEDVNGSQSCRYDVWFSKEPGGAVFVGGKVPQWCEQRGLGSIGGHFSATNCGLTKFQGQRFYINIRETANGDPHPCAGHLSVWTNNAKGNTRTIMTQTPADLK